MKARLIDVAINSKAERQLRRSPRISRYTRLDSVAINSKAERQLRRHGLGVDDELEFHVAINSKAERQLRLGHLLQRPGRQVRQQLQSIQRPKGN